MRISEYVIGLLNGRDTRERHETVDREIREVKAEIRNTNQALQSGARIVETMSGVMRLIAEEKRNEKNY